jgi:hypothetical protein
MTEMTGMTESEYARTLSEMTPDELIEFKSYFGGAIPSLPKPVGCVITRKPKKLAKKATAEAKADRRRHDEAASLATMTMTILEDEAERPDKDEVKFFQRACKLLNRAFVISDGRLYLR